MRTRHPRNEALIGNARAEQSRAEQRGRRGGGRDPAFWNLSVLAYSGYDLVPVNPSPSPVSTLSPTPLASLLSLSTHSMETCRQQRGDTQEKICTEKSGIRRSCYHQCLSCVSHFSVPRFSPLIYCQSNKAFSNVKKRKEKKKKRIRRQVFQVPDHVLNPCFCCCSAFLSCRQSAI